MTDEQLISAHIEMNPHKPWLAEARLRPFGQSVWAIVGLYHATGHNVNQVAEAYDLPKDAVLAAPAFYKRHIELIDARLAENTEAVLLTIPFHETADAKGEEAMAACTTPLQGI